MKAALREVFSTPNTLRYSARSAGTSIFISAASFRATHRISFAIDLSLQALWAGHMTALPGEQSNSFRPTAPP